MVQWSISLDAELLCINSMRVVSEMESAPKYSFQFLVGKIEESNNPFLIFLRTHVCLSYVCTLAIFGFLLE